MDQLLRQIPEKIELGEFLSRKGEELCLSGLTPSAHPLLIASLHIRNVSPIIVLLPNPESAERAYNDFLGFLDLSLEISSIKGETALFPPWELLPYELTTPHQKLMGRRLAALAGLLQGRITTVFTSYSALAQRLIPKWILAESVLYLKKGQQIALDAVLEFLVHLGYLPEAVVETPSQFSRRGGILDIFPVGEEEPLRLEFFGDEIDSLRRFNPVTQRSTTPVSDALVIPRREAVAPPGGFEALLERLKGRGSPYLPQLEKIILADEEQEGLEGFLPVLYGDTSLLTDYLSIATMMVVADSATVEEAAKEFAEQVVERYRSAEEGGILFPPPEECWAGLEELCGQPYSRRLVLEAESGGGAGEHFLVSERKRTSSRRFGEFSGQLEFFEREAERALQEGCRLIVACATEGDRRRLAEILPLHAEGVAEQCELVESSLAADFVWSSVGLAMTNDQAIFSRYKPRRVRKRFGLPKEVAPVTALGDLEPGDFCVHADHGIGVFLGLSVMKVGGVSREFATLEYAEGNKLYVPIEAIYKLFRYIGGDMAKPKIDRLGGAEWGRRKAMVKRSARDIARQLLELYARRQTASGFAYSPDTVWQYELEESFPYKETEDQNSAIMAIKEDMEKPRPMDRLVCGDVGYGKTEVAIRAAFKAVNDGKQVALLVPTTVLAAQHFETFKERLKSFPVEVAVLSRLVPPRQQKETIKGIVSGKVDIVIATHRLLSSDIRFADLGLLIVDEEQRFGVTHKERIKEMRAEVDVITLSATPIPRTLSMSLAGIRDLSIINTPPPGRLPIYTYIKRFGAPLICDSINREIERGGQVYFVHNRVESIAAMAEWLSRQLPKVRLKVAHGQLPEAHLAKIMTDFYAGHFDLLVTTTIIESGIDIPRVNTMIINRADTLGLAQLHQLRGRVGRSGEQAFCYLLIPTHGRISEPARRRLEAIRDFTELGSGLALALKDLETRGAGNILGAEQSGHIAAVGFETYTRLIAEAVAELRGEVPAKPPDVKMELSVEAYLPTSYVPEPKGRMGAYRRLSEAATCTAVAESEEMLRDMYGPPPKQARNLLAIARLRVVAERVGVESIREEGERIVIVFRERLKAEKFGGRGIKGICDVRLLTTSGGKVVFALRITSREAEERLAVLEDVLSRLE